jgi:hypothetical protein
MADLELMRQEVCSYIVDESQTKFWLREVWLIIFNGAFGGEP